MKFPSSGIEPPVNKKYIKGESKKFGKLYTGGSVDKTPPTRRPGYRQSGSTIYQPPLTDQGRENFDKIFRKG